MSSTTTPRFVGVVLLAGALVSAATCSARRDEESVGRVVPATIVPTAPADAVVEGPIEDEDEHEILVAAPTTTVDGTGDADIDETAGTSDAAPATTVPAGNADSDDRLSPITSPDAGDHCADGLSAAELTSFFSAPIGSFQGADYQRAIRLPDDRVLWTFQDAFLDDVLVHNAALVQSGRCFTLLNEDRRAWLLADGTDPMHTWYWPLDGAPAADGRIEVFVVQMHETGAEYLAHPVPVRVLRVVLDPQTFETVAIHREPWTEPDLYGWSITHDGTYSYLYSHCHRQFGYTGLFGFDACSQYVKVARVPVGDFGAPREYWNGWTWVRRHDAAVPVVDGFFVYSGINPAQIQFDGARFLLVEKRDDWWGDRVEIGVSDRAVGPFELRVSTPEPLACERGTCNTYFASWVPWREPDGSLIWAISCNLRDGSTTCERLELYGPTFHTTYLATS